MSYDDDYEPDADDIEDELGEEKPTTSEKGSISVTLNFDQWMNGSIEDHIIAKLVAALTTRLEASIKTQVETKMLKKINAEFDELARKQVEDYFMKQVKKTNSYGEPTGEQTNMRDLLAKKFQEYMSQKVDSKGNPSSYSDGLPRSQQMLNQLAHKPLQEAIDETVKGIAAKAKEQIQQTVSRYIAEQLSPTISVPAIGAK